MPSETAEASNSAGGSTFNGHHDPLTFGSSSVGLDIEFPHASHAYGLPERTVAHALPPTLGKEPYRLMNLDVFEYLLDHPMGLYGSVPFVQAAGPSGAQGMLWLNPSESWVDVGCDGAAGAGYGGSTTWRGAAIDRVARELMRRS